MANTRETGWVWHSLLLTHVLILRRRSISGRAGGRTTFTHTCNVEICHYSHLASILHSGSVSFLPAATIKGKWLTAPLARIVGLAVNGVQVRSKETISQRINTIKCMYCVLFCCYCTKSASWTENKLYFLSLRPRAASCISKILFPALTGSWVFFIFYVIISLPRQRESQKRRHYCRVVQGFFTFCRMWSNKSIDTTKNSHTTKPRWIVWKAFRVDGPRQDTGLQSDIIIIRWQEIAGTQDRRSEIKIGGREHREVFWWVPVIMMVPQLCWYQFLIVLIVSIICDVSWFLAGLSYRIIPNGSLVVLVYLS